MDAHDLRNFLGDKHVQVFTAALSPAIVAANTTAESAAQTVAGVAAGDIVLAVIKPTLQAGLFVYGGRVAGANDLRIWFGNDTGAGITPTAAEVYAVVVLR